MFTALIITYAALTALGLGVLAVDLFGALDHGDPAPAAHHGTAGGSDHALQDAHAGSHGHHQEGSDQGLVPDGVSTTGMTTVPPKAGRGQGLVRAYGAVRNLVYFGLGAGATGIFALCTGVLPVITPLWAAAAGVFVMFLVRGIRSLAQKELDSTIKDHEFLMDEARVLVPVLPGQMGKAVVIRYGKETEVYIRLADPRLSAVKGERVRILDVEGDCFTVEQEPDNPV